MLTSLRRLQTVHTHSLSCLQTCSSQEARVHACCCQPMVEGITFAIGAGGGHESLCSVGVPHGCVP